MIRITAEFPEGRFSKGDIDEVFGPPPLAALLESAAGSALEEELSNIEVRLVELNTNRCITEHSLLITVEIDQESLHHNPRACASSFRSCIDEMVDDFEIKKGKYFGFPFQYRISVRVSEAVVNDD